jgi:NADH:ubiquinone oxidoreductase subunit C
MSLQVKPVTAENLVTEVKKLFDGGYRFVTATCMDEIENFRVIYSLDKDLELVNLELPVGKEERVPSLTGVYLCAFLIENEMKELFGLNVTDIAVDLGGHLYMIDETNAHPMTRTQKKTAKGGE